MLEVLELHTGKVLASSRLLIRDCSSICKVGKLIFSLCALGFDVLCDGTCKYELCVLCGELGICVAKAWLAAIQERQTCGYYFTHLTI